MESLKRQRRSLLVYIALTLAALLWFAFPLSGAPSAPYDPDQTLKNEPIAANYSAEPMPAEEQASY